MASSAHPENLEVELQGVRKLTTVELVGGIYCHICEQIFDNKKQFDAHYVSTHEYTSEILYTCVVCRNFTANYPSLRGHCYNVHVSTFKCPTCSKSFTKQSSLNLHVKAMHIFKCKTPNCNKEYPTKKQLHMHQFVHKSKENKPPYPCQTCTEQIDSIDTCEQHIDDHSTFTYSCPICSQTGTKEDVSEHLATHFGSNQQVLKDTATDTFVVDNSSINVVGGIQCFMCNEIFKNRVEFDTHFASNHPDDNIVYMCLICKKKYDKYSKYGCHVYEHLWKNKFECEQCDRLFPRLALLVQHSESAHPLPAEACGASLRCAKCGRAFATQRHRRAHMKDAHGEDMLTCSHPDCDSMFDSPKELIIHQKLHKKAQDQDTWCRQCGLQFHSITAAEKHLDIHRTKEYECPVCSNTYSQKYLVMNHISQHFESIFHMCKICAKVFNAKNRLVQHVKTHSSVKAYECKQCGKGFSRSNHLQSHLAVHSGEKPYKCTVCEKTFASYPNFCKHMRKIHNMDTKSIKKANTTPPMNIEKTPQPEPEEPMSLTQNYQFETDDSTMDSEGLGHLVMQDSEMFERNDNPITDETVVAELLMLTSPSPEPTATIEPLPVAPREYGPDFLAPEYLGHIDPRLTVRPAPPAPPATPAPADFQPYYEELTAQNYGTPVLTKVYRNFYGDIDDMSRLPVLNTDIF